MRCVALAACCLAIVACLPTLRVQSRTRVLENGSLVRETTLTKQRADGDNEREKLLNARPVSEDFARSLGAGFPTIERTPDVVRLYGVFPDASAMPPDFAREVPLLKATAHNRVSLVREDLLAGTRYLYREEYVDAIAPEDAQEAKRDLVEMIGRFVRSAAFREFGREYELSAFDQWTRDELAPLTSDLIAMLHAERANFGRKDPHTGETGLDRVAKKLRARVGKLGIELVEPMDAPLNGLLLENALCDLLALKLKPRDPNRMPPKLEDFRYLFPEDAPASALARIARATAIADFGGEKQAIEDFQRATLAVSGTFSPLVPFDPPIQEGAFEFDCAVEMPGLLLRTNGVLEGDRSAFYLFDGDDLYPAGKALELESVVFDTGLLGRIRELKSEPDRRDAVQLILALDGADGGRRAEMRAALEECARQGTLAWLDDPARAETKKRFARVIEILRRPN